MYKGRRAWMAYITKLWHDETFAHLCSVPASQLPRPLEDPLPVGHMHPGQSLELRADEDAKDLCSLGKGTQIFSPEPTQHHLQKSFDEQDGFALETLEIRI